MSKARLKRIEERLKYKQGNPLGVYFLDKTEKGFVLYGKDPEGQKFDTEKAAVDYFDTLTADNGNLVLLIDTL